MKTLSRALIAVLASAWLLALFVLPTVIFAQEGLVPACPVGDTTCTEAYHPDNYGICEVVALSNNVIRFLVGLIALIATIALVYRGYQMVMSMGNPTALTKAKDLVVNVLVGMVIMLSAFLVVNTVMGILVGQDSALLNWNSFTCQYANEVGDAVTSIEYQNTYTNEVVYEDNWIVVDRYNYVNGYSTVVGGSNYIGGGGSCSVISDPQNACYPMNLTCFGNTSDASKICNLESSGGNPNAISSTDICEDGRSFSGGLFQINVLANYNLIPGCSGGFFVKEGSSAQGDCAKYVTNSKGVTYCAVRKCQITDVPKYTACMNAVLNASTNIKIACSLYANGGWRRHWETSAKTCGVI